MQSILLAISGGLKLMALTSLRQGTHKGKLFLKHLLNLNNEPAPGEVKEVPS